MGQRRSLMQGAPPRAGLFLCASGWPPCRRALHAWPLRRRATSFGACCKAPGRGLPVRRASARVSGLMAPRILVVDDNQELLSLLTQLFEDAGYEVVGASRGKQGLDAARAHPPGVAVLDILLPDMMGYQLA